MPRTRLLGSHGFNPEDTRPEYTQLYPFPNTERPPYAIMKFPGHRDNNMVTNGLYFPIALDPATFVRYVHGIKGVRIQIVYSKPLDLPGFFATSGQLDGQMLYQVDDEIDFLEQFPMPLMAGGLFGSQTVSNGVDPPFTGEDSAGFFCGICNYTDFVVNTGDKRFYVYDESNDLWYPRLAIDSVTTSFGQVSNSPIPGAGVQDWPATFFGHPIRVFTQTNPAHQFTSFNLSVTPSAWWPHVGASGPIWDANTGAPLQPHNTTED